MSRLEYKQPDLDWSQVKETVKLLTASVLLVETSMHEGDSSVTSLSESFITMAEHINTIEDQVKLSESGQQKEAALHNCAEMTEKINASIVAFQFYDRLHQSLSHAVESLKGLSQIVDNPERLYNPLEWNKFQQEIRSRFTMETEKIMFDAIIAGKSIEEAAQLAAKSEDGRIDSEDDIELF